MKKALLFAIFGAALLAFIPAAQAGRPPGGAPPVTPPPKSEGPGVVSKVTTP